MKILDTHQHLIYPEKYRYSWTDGIPQLKGRAFRYEDYQAAIAGTGISRVLFMESAPDEPHDEVHFISGLPVNGLIANCRPENPDFERQMDELAGLPVVGLRRILHVVPDEVSQSELFATNLRTLEKCQWSFDLCFLARQLPLAVDLARKCPNVQFILDHCGVPEIGSLDPWSGNIRQLANLPNVACKISGVLAYCKPGEATASAVRPYVEHCIESFGWDRVVWGSDWPVVLMNSTLADWVNISRELVAGESVENQQKLFYDNARRIYRVQD